MTSTPMPELKIRLFPSRYEARGYEAIATLRRPLVLLTLTTATVAMFLGVLYLTNSRGPALLLYLASRWL